MIAFVDRDWTGEIANRLRGVGRYHASRLVVLAYEPKRERLDARVTISTDDPARPGELALLRETVVVELGDRHLDDLLTIADPLVVTDLPTLLWSPHGHHEIIDELLPLAQAVLLDSVEEPDYVEALERAAALSQRAYVVDLAWLRSTPWRERVAAIFDPPWLRPELRLLSGLTVRHHPASTVAARCSSAGSPRGWAGEPRALLSSARRASCRARPTRRRQDVELRLQVAPELQVPGLAGPHGRDGGRPPAAARPRAGRPARALLAARAKTSASGRSPAPRAARPGVLGEGIRQALLRDPTYLPAVGAARAMLA